MPKKRKKSSAKGKSAGSKSDRMEKQILENLVSLQKVHTDLAEKFDKLTKELSNLLTLFEVTAKNFAKNLPKGEIDKDKEFLDKIDKLLDQNKTIAKGLTLMEDRMKQRVYGGANSGSGQREQEQMQPSISARPRPLPRF
jgi:hypothetical protein